MFVRSVGAGVVRAVGDGLDICVGDKVVWGKFGLIKISKNR